MAEKIRLGIIGLGGIATRSHIPALIGIQDVAITAGAEIDEYQAKRTQNRFGIPQIYAGYEEMLEKEPLEGVYICLPNKLHYAAACMALDRGLHVYCEKPVGLSAREAEDLAFRAEKSKVILMPGYHLRFNNNFVRAHELIANRRLGKIIQVQASADYSGPYRGWDPKSDWPLDPQSGGPLYDWGSHLFDLLLFITGIDVQVISANADRSLPGMPLLDSVGAVFRANKGIIGTANLAWGARGNLLMLQIHGTAGSLIVSEDYFEHRTPTGGGWNKIGTLLGNARDIFSQKTSAFIQRRSVDLLYVKAAENFVAAIQGKAQLTANIRDAIHVHQVLSAIRSSLEQGKPISCAATPTRIDREAA